MKITNVLKSIILTGSITILTSISVFAAEHSTILNHYTTQDNEVVTQYSDGTNYTNFDTTIQSIDKIKNTVTIEHNGELYSFYADDIDNYYLNEQINITIDDKYQIVDSIVDEQPQVYNTTIIYSQDKVACFRLNNGDVYSFNLENEGDWKVNDKCKVIIQNDNVLEVRPIPLDER